MRALSNNDVNVLLGGDFTGENQPRAIVFLDGYYMDNVMNFEVTREENSYAQMAKVVLSNINPTDVTDTGYYNQLRNDSEHNKPQNSWWHKIQPDKEVKIMAGYGTNVTTVFTGYIDEVRTNHTSNTCLLTVVARDNGKKWVENNIRCYNSNISSDIDEITYPIQSGIVSVYLTTADTNPYLHEIFIDVCHRAGFATDKVGYDEFDLRLNDLEEKYFVSTKGKWENIIKQIATILNANVFVDEDNSAQLRKVVDKDYRYDDTITLTGTSWLDLTQETGLDFAIEDSIVFDSGYEKDVDWEFDQSSNSIRRLSGSSIPDGTPVEVEFSYVSWIFKNGQTLYELEQKSSHDEVYHTLVAKNEELGLRRSLEVGALGDGSTLSFEKQLVTDLPELINNTDLDNWLTDKKEEIRHNYFGCKANVVAVPQLQINDLIQFVVYGTISGIYKIIGFGLNYTSADGFQMNVKTAYYINYDGSY